MARLAMSQNERLLLHLWEMDKYRDEPEVPLAASQEGIAQVLQVQVHNASRALSSLQAEGLVSDRLTHVRGAPRRRRAYSLTDKGRSAAQAIKSDVMKRAVALESDGKVQEMTVEDALRKISSLVGITPSLTAFVDVARVNDLVVADSFAALQAQKPAQEFPIAQQGRPKVEAFFGREKELKSMTDALADSSVSAVLLWGMPGIGKSTLASRAFDEMAGKRPLFWFSFREWDTETSFLIALAAFLSSNGRNGTESALRRGSHAGDMFLPLSSDLSSGNIALFLDDVQKGERLASTVLSMLLEAAKASQSAKVVMIARSVPSFFSKTAPGNLAFEISGLDRDSAWKLAQSLDAKEAVKVVSESHGHPLLIRLMARGGATEAKGDVLSFIEREVYSALNERERRVLEQLSIFRHPVKLDALEGLDYSAIVVLKQRALIVEQESGLWTHDLLREFMSARLTASAKSELHSGAARYCAGNPGVEWKLETLHHLAEAEDWVAAVVVAIANANELSKEFPEETLALLSRVPEGTGVSGQFAELLFIRGQLNEILGRREDALADFEQSLSLLGDGQSGTRAIVLEAVAKLHSQIERLTESLAVHQNALKLYEKSDDKGGQTREWLNIAGVYRKRADWTKAREADNKALTLATMQEDRSAQAACLNNLALLDWDEGRLRDAEVRLRESVRLSHLVKDHLGEANGLENLAMLSKAQNRLSDASNLLLESSEAFRRAGELSESKRLQAVCAASLGEQGRFEPGIELCEKALARPELRRRKGLFQRSPRYDRGDLALASALTDLLRESGDYRRARKELAGFNLMATAIGDPVELARGSMMAAMIDEGSGELDDAVKHLGEAETLLAQTGDHGGLVAVHMRLGIVDEKRDDYSGAAKHYEEAARHADFTGDAYAKSVAEESLAMVRKS
ncbi:MAG TPA: tetratricopeptide repeat protein [Thermoplasmata archaeon]